MPLRSSRKTRSTKVTDKESDEEAGSSNIEDGEVASFKVQEEDVELGDTSEDSFKPVVRCVGENNPLSRSRFAKKSESHEEELEESTSPLEESKSPLEESKSLSEEKDLEPVVVEAKLSPILDDSGRRLQTTMEEIKNEEIAKMTKEKEEDSKQAIEESDEPSAKKRKLSEDEVKEEKPEDSIPEATRPDKLEKVFDKSPQLRKFWKVVTDDPDDFTGWTYLLQHVETLDDPVAGREAYNAFLSKYPYCYGYWKKYADFEKKRGCRDSCLEVFERGVNAIPLSADLWIHYLNFIKADPNGGEESVIRDHYERAVEACGREWRSDKLWDFYVKWEIEKKNFNRVLELYDRILRNPTQGLAHQFEMFREFVKEHNPKEYLPVDEFLSLRKEVLGATKGLEESKTPVDEEDHAPPGEDENSMKSDEETLAMRERIIFMRRKVYKATEEQLNVKWKYEEGIKRPYFHVKPLEAAQLKNWSEYLKFEKSRGDESKVKFLYERCLIACALYEEFWSSYADWLQTLGGPGRDVEVQRVYSRACRQHLPNKVDIRLKWINFEECIGNFNKASELLRELEEKQPDNVLIILKRINLERRRKNYNLCHQLFEKCITKAGKQNTASDISIKYARFVRLLLGNAKMASEILESALTSDEKNPKLYLQLLDIAFHEQPLSEEKVVSTFDLALSKELSPKHRHLFSQRKLEFLEDFGSDVSAITKAREEHDKLCKEIKPYVKDEEDPSTSTERGGSGISTIQGQGKGKVNGTSHSSSAAYGAQQQSQYSQYGQRYSQYPTNYNYNYYQSYSSSTPQAGSQSGTYPSSYGYGY